MRQLARRMAAVQSQLGDELAHIMGILEGQLSEAWEDRRYEEFKEQLAAELRLLDAPLAALGLLAEELERRREPLVQYLQLRARPGAISWVKNVLVDGSIEVLSTAVGNLVVAPMLGGGKLGDYASSILMDGAAGFLGAFRRASAGYRQGHLSASQATANVAVEAGLGLVSGLADAAIGMELLPSLLNARVVMQAWAGAVVVLGAANIPRLPIPHAIAEVFGDATLSIGVDWTIKSLAQMTGFSEWAKYRLGAALQRVDPWLTKAWDGVATSSGKLEREESRGWGEAGKGL